MAFQTVFERYELKYLLTYRQKEKVMQAMEAHMEPDRYGRTTIRNIYYDTDNYLLVRRSIEKPIYKEKLRIRSYEKVRKGSKVFVELKRKYSDVVYKRRVCIEEGAAIDWLNKGIKCVEQTQISQEIDYFLDFYKTLRPATLLSYDREAYFAKDSSDFRVTFDDNILCRQEDMSLASEIYGTRLLSEGTVLMELKCSGAMPLWIARTLSEVDIHKQSFSKYGTAYGIMIYPQLSKEKIKTEN